MSNAQPPAARIIAQAVALVNARKSEEAAVLLRDHCAAEPESAQGWYYLGCVEEQLGNQTAARESHARCVALDTRHADAQHNLGRLLHLACDLDAAEQCYRQAIRVRADFAQAHYNLGLVLDRKRRYGEALPHLEKAGNLLTGDARIQVDLALVHALTALHRNQDAERIVQRVLEMKPEDALAWHLAGSLHQDRKRLVEACACYRRAISLGPPLAESHCSLGSVLLIHGHVAEAATEFRTAIAIKPGWAAAHSNLLLALNYTSEDGKANLAAHKEWAARHEAPLPRVTRQREFDPSHRLRIAYVSPDFRAHSVAWFLEGVLSRHDRKLVEVFCYSDVTNPDSTTERLKTYADHWRDTAGLDDAALADCIAADAIDVLVDLAGHTARNRLPTFARKPAPVQISWLGYPNTTGLDAMDYRITDAVADPPGMTEAFHSETLVRLPYGFLCYTPPTDEVEIGPPPCIANGFITFGSFNLLAKLTPSVLRIWATLLRALPGSRLHLKADGLEDQGANQRVLSLFVSEGIGAERLLLHNRTNRLDSHLAHYRRIDIALDPAPYNGTTTTCEALWMGVPVITLAGQLHAGRVGASLLHRIGRPEWIADSPEDYIAIARKLAEDPGELAIIRAGLRTKLLASSLCDAAGFTRTLETACRTIWHDKCQRAS